jgi:hypothetical protein
MAGQSLIDSQAQAEADITAESLEHGELGELDDFGEPTIFNLNPISSLMPAGEAGLLGQKAKDDTTVTGREYLARQLYVLLMFYSTLPPSASVVRGPPSLHRSSRFVLKARFNRHINSSISALSPPP